MRNIINRFFRQRFIKQFNWLSRQDQRNLLNIRISRFRLWWIHICSQIEIWTRSNYDKE